MDEFEKELKVSFLDEAAQSVADVEQCFLALESDPNDIENINKIFRLAHNLKGSSKAVGFDEFGAFTHQFESFILKIKNGELKTSGKVVNLLLRLNDHVAQMIAGLKADLNATFDSQALLSEMENFQDGGDSGEESSSESAEAAPEAESEVDSNFGFGRQNEAAAPLSFIGSQEPNAVAAPPVVEEKTPIVPLEVVAEVKPVEAKQPPKSPPPAGASSNPAGGGGGGGGKGAAVTEESIRVALSKVETLINFVGEMVILQSVMREQANQTDSILLKKTVQQLGKVGKEIQEIAMGLRMVPVKQTFQKMQRIVRDTAQVLNKDVGIILVGEETELDKTVLEKINDPLVHLIRNSVDHGIEAVELREKRGKPARGNVHLIATHQAGKLVLEVRDDGGGLDPEKLKNKAIEKGILKPGTQMSDKDAMNLIFAPGFSTKEQVTDVSGRGVGMDVVRTNINELGGEIFIESELGKGTTFKIVLPLTLAIIDSMVLTYSKEKFVIPLNHVFETLQPTPEMVQYNTALGETLILRGENMPLVRLGDFFGIKNSNTPQQMIAMVIRSTRSPFAILVDDIIGQYQVVIKQLGPELQGIKGVSGSTILGDGKPALIIEPQELLKRKVSNNYVPVQAHGGKAA